MKLFLQRIVMVILAIGLVACMSSKEKAFRDEGSVSPMLIPAGYASNKVDNYYQVPNLHRNTTAAQTTGKSVNLVPPGAHKH